MSKEVIQTAKNTVSTTARIAKTGITKFFDFFAGFDNKMQGKRIKLFAWGCAITLFIAPFIDYLFDIFNNNLTFYSTIIFSIFVTIVAIAFVEFPINLVHIS